MRVSQIAELLHTTVDTVRFYTRKGYLHPVVSSENGYRSYRDADVQRLRFIINARQLGFTVDEIGQLIGQAEKGEAPCPLVRNLITEHLRETEKQFAEVMALRKRLKAAIKDWDSKPDKLPTGHMICHLIEEWES